MLERSGRFGDGSDGLTALSSGYLPLQTQKDKSQVLLIVTSDLLN